MPNRDFKQALSAPGTKLGGEEERENVTSLAPSILANQRLARLHVEIEHARTRAPASTPSLRLRQDRTGKVR